MELDALLGVSYSRIKCLVCNEVLLVIMLSFGWYLIVGRTTIVPFQPQLSVGVWLLVQGKGQGMGSTASDPIMSSQQDLSHYLLFVVLYFFLDLSHYLLFKDALDAKSFVGDFIYSPEYVISQGLHNNWCEVSNKQRPQI